MSCVTSFVDCSYHHCPGRGENVFRFHTSLPILLPWPASLDQVRAAQELVVDILTLSTVESSLWAIHQHKGRVCLSTVPPDRATYWVKNMAWKHFKWGFVWFCRHAAKPACPLLQQLNVLCPPVRSGRGINGPETVSCSLCKLLP